MRAVLAAALATGLHLRSLRTPNASTDVGGLWGAAGVPSEALENDLAAVSAEAAVPQPALPQPAGRAEVTKRLRAWCENATAYLTGEVNAFASEHSDAASQLAAAANESRAVQGLFAHLRRAGLPESTEPGAGVEAAQRVADAQLMPEYKTLLDRRVAATVLSASASAAFHDAEILQRTIGDLLGAALRACRSEENLDHNVEQALLLPGSLPVLLQLARAVPHDETLKVLRERKAHLESRAQECAHMRAGQERNAELRKLSEAHGAAASEQRAKRASGDADLLAEFREVERGVTVLEEGEERIFSDEQVVYSREAAGEWDIAEAAEAAQDAPEGPAETPASSLWATGATAGSKQPLPARIAAGVAERRTAQEMDAIHRFWVMWRDGLKKAFTQVKTYLSKRLSALRESGARHEYLRTSAATQAERPPKSPAPDGLACPTEAELATQQQDLETAIAEVAALDKAD